MCNSHGSHSCKDYLVVEPRKGGFWDLFKLLWSHQDIGERSCLESPDGKKLTQIRHRWIVFVSVITQKILIRLESPLARVGFGLCVFLNLLSSNGGLFGLFLNSITALSIMASRLSYENDAFIKMVVQERWQVRLHFLGKLATRAFMLKDPNQDPNLIVVAFRGTDPFDAVAMQTDVDISWYELQGVGKIHGGFMKALGLQKNTGWPNNLNMGQAHLQFAYYTIRARLKEELQQNKDAKFLLTGHSLGGALAILMAGVLMLHGEKDLLDRLKGVYTFGQPRVGDTQFGEFMKTKLKFYDVNYHRYVYCNDIVPRLPYDDKTLVFKHFGPCIYYDSLYKGKVIDEAPNKNYFSWIWMIPEFLNAIWELIRGVILPWREGPYYIEGWFLTIFRLIGLIIPGFADHGPQDYQNIICLGVISSPLDINTSNAKLGHEI
ncbi:hypothetical protein V2J09_007147 [Rumex salicifolius]